jgi:myosin heavy subunit
MEIIKELSDKWASLSSMQQAPIIEALGGKYRGNMLTALLENFNVYEKMLAEYANGVNSAIIENEKRLESWNSKLAQLTNSISEYWNNAIDTDIVKGAIDLTKELVESLDNTNKEFGIVATTLYTLITALAIFKGQAISGAIAGMGGLSASLIAFATNPVTLVVAGLVGLGVATVNFSNEMQKAKERTESITTAYQDFNKALNAGKIEEVTSALKNLTETVDYNNAIKKISQLKQEILDLQDVANKSPIVGSDLSFGMNETRLTTKQAELDRLEREASYVDRANELMLEKVIRKRKNKNNISTNNTTNTTNAPSPNSLPDDTNDITTTTPDLEKPYQSLYNIIRDLNYELSRQNEILSQTEDSDQIPILSKRNELLEQQKKNLHDINEARREELAKLKPTSDRYQELIDKIQDTSLEWWQLDSAQKSNLDTIKKINEEQEKNIENQIKETVELEKKLKLQQAENNLKEDLLNIEQEIYGTTQDAWEEASNTRIDELEEELELLEEKNDKEQESVERAERLLEIQRQQDKINNLKKERNVRVLTQNGWEWQYDKQAVQVETDRLRELQTSYSEWEQQNRLERKRRNIQLQIEEEREIQKTKKDSYDKQKQELENAYEAEKSSIESAYFDIDSIVLERMDVIKATHNAKLDEMLVDARNKLATLQKLYQEALDMQATIEEINIDTPSSSSSSSSSSSGSTSVLGNIWNGFKDLIGLESGGKTVGEGLAFLHDKEIVLNKVDTENLLKAVDITRNMIQPPKMPQFSPVGVGGNSNSTVYNLNIAKVITDDANSFVDLLPTLVTQYKK